MTPLVCLGEARENLPDIFQDLLTKLKNFYILSRIAKNTQDFPGYGNHGQTATNNMLLRASSCKKKT